MNKFRLISLVLVLFAGCAGSDLQLNDDHLPMPVKIAGTKLLLSASELCVDSLRYPRATDSTGHWQTVPPRDWTSGFFPGSLWYEYRLTKKDVYRDLAMRWTEGLRQQQYLTKSHDIGFIIMSSFGNRYRMTHDSACIPVIVQAGKSLMTRYNPKVGCIRSWDNRQWAYPVIIDNMMNLELLFQAAKFSGSKEMYDAAVSHARKTLKNHFRPDGSTYHVVSYDTATGNVLQRVTHQGSADESVWARGQAWAIYGFTMVYRETHEKEFLDAACRAADWYLAHLPADYVPYWDFRAPKIPAETRDASAAAIAASGLLELDLFASKEHHYRTEALRTISALSSPAYYSSDTLYRGIIRHSVGNGPKNSEVDVTLIYGDYYFLEAFYRAIYGGVKDE